MNSKRTTKGLRSAVDLIQKTVPPDLKATGNEVAIQPLELDNEGTSSQNGAEPSTGPSPPVPWKNKGAAKKKRRTSSKRAARKKRR